MMSVERGTCPVCSGTKRKPAGDNPYKKQFAGYDPETDTLWCDNCGGQTMYAVATGLVRLRPDGTPCAHDYAGEQTGRCYYSYVCKHCGDFYSIDSGD